MRRLFTILSVLSLLVALIATGFWVRSFWGGWDRFSIRHVSPETATTLKEAEFVLVNQKPSGGFEMAYVTAGGYVVQSFTGGHLGWNLKYFHGDDSYLVTGFLGFAYYHRQKVVGMGSVEAYSVTLPHYFVFAVALILPAIWLYRFRRERLKARNNCCMACGYDLRASKDKCPECGAAIVTPVS